jgi:hypothetical protein
MKYIVLKKSGQKIAFFFLGLILGSILCTLQIGNNIDRLSRENNELKLELDNTLKELSDIKENSQANKGYVITKIQTDISFSPDSLTAAEAEKLKIPITKEVAKHYQSLIGSQVTSLNPILLPKLIDGRLFRIDGKYFKIFVKTLVLSETLFINIEVHPQ